jgi:geranylgeranyl diphosphate synthase type I
MNAVDALRTWGLQVNSNQLKRMLEGYKKPIERHLEQFLLTKGKQLETVNRWGPDLTDRLVRFCTGGKLIRGSLILLSSDMFSAGGRNIGTAVASAYELIHSFLLIHDDIMDRDEMRRGMPSIFYQYKKIVQGEERHAGESFGICAGDVAAFLAIELLTLSDADPGVTFKILALWSRELQQVGVAQMQDVYFSTLGSEVAENDIITLYRYKTARYTFSVPFATGALLTRQNHRMVEKMLTLGEYYGLIYQLIDDKIGLYGKATKIGKPVGTDLEEKKKTLLLHYLFRLSSHEQKKKVTAVLQKDRISQADLEYIRNAATGSGTVQKIEEKITALKQKAEKMLKELPVREGFRNALEGLLNYGVKRKL